MIKIELKLGRLCNIYSTYIINALYFYYLKRISKILQISSFLNEKEVIVIYFNIYVCGIKCRKMWYSRKYSRGKYDNFLHISLMNSGPQVSKRYIIIKINGEPEEQTNFLFYIFFRRNSS